MWMSGFLAAGPEEGRSFFRNIVSSVFIFDVTIEKVLEEVYEDGDIQPLSKTVMLHLNKVHVVACDCEVLISASVTWCGAPPLFAHWVIRVTLDNPHSQHRPCSVFLNLDVVYLVQVWLLIGFQPC
jgi:hypothetical protein